MKGKLLIIIYFVTSFFLTAQISDLTYDDSKSVISDSLYGQFITEMHFGAYLYKNHFVNAQELLDNIKSLCKDKAIFIDFWATWCSPCIKAMPYNKRMYFETKDLPIEFIYCCTSIGSTLDNWITKISVFRQPGIHIFVDSKVNTELMRLLSVGGYPSYVFIDANGEYKPGAIPVHTSTTVDMLKGLIKK